MKQLVIFSFGANVAESKLLTKLTEIHFVKLIGDRHVFSVNDMGRDFNRDDGWGLAETLAQKDHESKGNLGFAVVCEYPTRNILEWYESVRDTWGADRSRLYIRITEDMSIHPLVYTYATMDIKAKDILDNPDFIGTEKLAPKMFAKKNCFGEYEIAIPKTINVEAYDEEEFSKASALLSPMADLLQVSLVINHIPSIPKETLDEEEELRHAYSQE